MSAIHGVTGLTFCWGQRAPCAEGARRWVKRQTLPSLLPEVLIRLNLTNVSQQQAEREALALIGAAPRRTSRRRTYRSEGGGREEVGRGASGSEDEESPNAATGKSLAV